MTHDPTHPAPLASAREALQRVLAFQPQPFVVDPQEARDEDNTWSKGWDEACEVYRRHLRAELARLAAPTPPEAGAEAQSEPGGDAEGVHRLREWPNRARRACLDCGRRYGNEFGFPDLVVDNAVWLRISPTGHEGGLLCPSCMCRRAHDAGVECKATFRSGPFCEDGSRQPAPTPGAAASGVLSDEAQHFTRVGVDVVSVLGVEWAPRATDSPRARRDSRDYLLGLVRAGIQRDQAIVERDTLKQQLAAAETAAGRRTVEELRSLHDELGRHAAGNEVDAATAPDAEVAKRGSDCYRARASVFRAVQRNIKDRIAALQTPAEGAAPSPAASVEGECERAMGELEAAVGAYTKMQISASVSHPGPEGARVGRAQHKLRTLWKRLAADNARLAGEVETSRTACDLTVARLTDELAKVRGELEAAKRDMESIGPLRDYLSTGPSPDGQHALMHGNDAATVALVWLKLYAERLRAASAGGNGAARAVPAFDPDDIERMREGMLLTYLGGHRSKETVEAFQQGMNTACNVFKARLSAKQVEQQAPAAEAVEVWCGESIPTSCRAEGVLRCMHPKDHHGDHCGYGDDGNLRFWRGTEEEAAAREARAKAKPAAEPPPPVGAGDSELRDAVAVLDQMIVTTLFGETVTDARLRQLTHVVKLLAERAQRGR